MRNRGPRHSFGHLKAEWSYRTLRRRYDDTTWFAPSTDCDWDETAVFGAEARGDDEQVGTK